MTTKNGDSWKILYFHFVSSQLTNVFYPDTPDTFFKNKHVCVQ